MQFPQQMRLKARRYAALLSSALLSGAAVVSMQRGLAQSPPACDPPSANEYLLLVTNEQAGTEEQLRQLLPANAAITSCQYLDDQVVRVGGFANAEIADAWAKYVTDSTGLQAFVAGPTSGSTTAAVETETAPTDSVSPSNETNSSEASNFPTPTEIPSAGATNSAAPTETPITPDNASESELPSLNQAPSANTAPVAPTPSPTAAPSTPTSPSATNVTTTPTAPSNPGATQSFDPKPLGSGYAVLVNYANRPEVAADVRQVTSQPVGLVSYNQRPFLLAAYTTDPAAATAVLQSLNDRGFNAIIIDSRSAILLTPTVVGTGG